MKQEVLVPVITRTAENLVSRMNEQIRMMNLMVDQLYWQAEKMNELRVEKKRYFDNRNRRVYSIEEAEKRLENKQQEVEELKNALEGVSYFNIKQRIILTKKLKLAEDQLEAIHDSVLRLNHVLNTKDDYYGRLEDEFKRVNIPNYINHLAKFYGAHRSYKQDAKRFKALTGVDAPEIEVGEIILFKGPKGTLPVVNIDKIIPNIELELDYDAFDEDEERV